MVYEGDDGAGGASSEGLDGAAAALAGGEGGGGGGGDATGGGGGGGEGGGGAGADPEWLGQFSADGGDAENPSNRDWLKSKGFKTLDDVAKSYRTAEQAIHGKGVIHVPGDDATDAERAAFNKAIGVPDKADGYELALPEGVTEEQLDMPLLSGLKEQALAAGIPAKGFNALVETVIRGQLDALEAARTGENGSRDALLKEWGAQKDARMADVNNAMRSLGLKATDVAAIQRGFAMQYGEPGSRRTLELLQKLGAGFSEDVLLGNDGPRRFGITGAEAQKEIDTLIGDKAFGAKLADKDPDAVARWDRLNAAVAADRERQQRAAQAG